MRRILLVMTLVFIGFLNLDAQNAAESKVSIGVYTGYGLNQFSYDYKTILDNENVEFEGDNFSFSLLSEISIFSNKLDMRLEYAKYNINNKIISDTTSVIYHVNDGAIQLLENYEIDAEMLSFAVNYKFELIENLNINPGVKFSYVSQSNELIYLELDPGELRFIVDPNSEYINNYRGLVMKRGQLHENNIQIFASMGIDYEIEVIPSFIIQPEFKYYYSLTELSSTNVSKLHHFNLGLAVKYEL